MALLGEGSLPSSPARFLAEFSSSQARPLGGGNQLLAGCGPEAALSSLLRGSSQYGIQLPAE